MVPHPGPQPPPFEFPFAEARAALDAIEALVDALSRGARAHEQAAALPPRAFEGASRDAHERWSADVLDELRGQRSLLDDDAAHLRHRLLTAHHAQLDRERARAGWRVAHDRYLADRRERELQRTA
jgi:hypothetical protein